MRHRLALVIGIALLLPIAAACGTGGGSGDGTAAPGSTATSTAPSGEASSCAPIRVVVSVDPWRDVVEELGGTCVEVTTLIQGSSADPHDYEPTAADIAAFSEAELVVVNGVDYDHWAEDAVATLSPRPAVVNGGEVTDAEEGDNPHLWYDPDAVTQISEAITTELSALQPSSAPYFEARAADWDAARVPYEAEIEAIRASFGGTQFASTESVFDDMAAALGLENVTPQGYRNAAANESDPAPGDLAAFQSALRDGRIAVLVVNTQTEGSIPEQLRSVADGAGVPVVEVTETLPPGIDSFVEWQLSQLEALRRALT